MQVKTKNLDRRRLAVLLVGRAVVPRRLLADASQGVEGEAQPRTTPQLDVEDLQQAIDGDRSATKQERRRRTSRREACIAAIPADAAEASFLRSRRHSCRVSSACALPVDHADGRRRRRRRRDDQRRDHRAGAPQDQLARYLSGLSSSSRLVVVDNVSLTAGAAAAQRRTRVRRPATVFAGPVHGAELRSQITAPAVHAARGAGTAAAAPTAPASGRAPRSRPACRRPATARRRRTADAERRLP